MRLVAVMSDDAGCCVVAIAMIAIRPIYMIQRPSCYTVPHRLFDESDEAEEYPGANRKVQVAYLLDDIPDRRHRQVGSSAAAPRRRRGTLRAARVSCRADTT